MKLDLLYDKNGYYIGYSKEDNLLCAWTSIIDPFTKEVKPVILCQFNSKTKKACFSVCLADEDIDHYFVFKLEEYLNKYGFNKKED